MKAIFAGTFDPFTIGHKNIVERAVGIFGNVIVAVAHNTGKNAAPLDVRVDIVKNSICEISGAIAVPFDGLLTDFAAAQGECVLIRGIRSSRDWEYECDHSFVYKSLGDIETVCLISDAKYGHISSSVVREIASLGGNIDGYVVPSVRDVVAEHYGKR